MIRIVDTERIAKKISVDEAAYSLHSLKVRNSIRDAPLSPPLMQIFVELPEEIVVEAMPSGKRFAVCRPHVRLRGRSSR